MRFISLLLLGICAVCSHMVVLGLYVRLLLAPYVDAETVMRVLLYLLDVCNRV